jgi:hypothetical protein
MNIWKEYIASIFGAEELDMQSISAQMYMKMREGNKAVRSMEAADSSEILITFYQSTRHHIPEHIILTTKETSNVTQTGGV